MLQPRNINAMSLSGIGLYTKYNALPETIMVASSGNKIMVAMFSLALILRDITAVAPLQNAAAKAARWPI